MSGQLPFTTKNVSDFQRAPCARFDFRQFPFMDFLNLKYGIFPFLTQDLSDINCGWEVVGLPCGVIVMEARPLIGRLLFQGGN